MLKIVFSIIVYGALTVFIILLIIDIIKLNQKIKAVSKLRKISDPLEVEAEIKEAVFREMSKSKDKEFILLLSYIVNGTEYSKELSLYCPPNAIPGIAVGSKIMLICDRNDPNHAVLRDGIEETSLKKLLEYDVAYIVCAVIVALVVFFVGGLNFL